MKLTMTLSKATKTALKEADNVKSATQATVKFMADFMELFEWSARNTLLRVFFAPEKVIEDTELLKKGGVTPEILKPLYEDLASNYALLHPYCWLNSDKVVTPELFKELSGDRTLLYKVEETVGKAYADAPFEGDRLENLRILLTSQEPAFRFGGLRKLGFTKKEADFFKGMSEAIYAYIRDTFTNMKEEVEPGKEEQVVVTPDLSSDTVTAVEAEVEIKNDLDIDQLLYDAAKENKRHLEEKLKTAYIIAKALVSQIEDIAREAGVDYK